MKYLMDFGGLSFETLTRIAKESTDTGLLDEMVKEELRKYETAIGKEEIDKIVTVLCGICENRSTNKKTLDDLSNFPHSKVRCSVARNTLILKKTIKKLAKDSNRNVRMCVAMRIYEESHQDILQQIVEENYDDADMILRMVQWSDPGQEILEQLIHYKRDTGNSTASCARDYIAQKLTNPEKLDEMYDDPDWGVKSRVIQNSNTYKKTIIKMKENLKEDEDHYSHLRSHIQEKLQES